MPKKFKAKTRKSVKKRIKFSNGGDVNKGKMIVNRINDNHLNLKKRRVRKLRSRRDTILSSVHAKLRKVIK